MHPSQAHDVVEQLMKERLAEAEATRLGRRRRDRRQGRMERAAAALDETKPGRLVLVTPRTAC